MEKVTLVTKADNTPAFVLYDNQQKAGEMVVTVRGSELTAEHTKMVLASKLQLY